MDEEKVSSDISIHLPTIDLEGILNASDSKEIKKILLHKPYHYLISLPLLRFVDSFKQLQSNNNDGKKQDYDDEIIDIEQQIRTFQNDVRPSIQQAIQLSYKDSIKPNNKNNTITLFKILNKLDENTIISKDILYLIENTILNMKCINENTIFKSITNKQCYELMNCKNIQTLEKDNNYILMNDILEKEIEIYKQCFELLNDEINMLQSIFSAEHDEIMIHSNCLPIIIELCLHSVNKFGKLYMTFLCPISYPLKSPIKCAIYFNGPNDFASNNEIWIDLQFELQKMSQNSIGEQHLFDMVQFAKEWIEKYDEKYNELMKQKTINNNSHKYIELRTALGLFNKKLDANKPIIQINNNEMDENKNKNVYIWYWKDINRNWNEYPKNMQKKINNLGINDGFVSFSTNNYNYTVIKTSEAKGIQINSNTNNQTQIKRKIRKLKSFNNTNIKKNKKNNKQIEHCDDLIHKRGSTKKERRKIRQQLEHNKKIRKKEKQKHIEYYSDSEQDEILLKKQLKQQQIQKDKIRREQLETQCYSSWEIDETIQKLIKTMSNKWKCDKSIAKQKLAENLWTSDISIDKQLQEIRNKRQIDNNNQTEMDIISDIILIFPENKSFNCPICLENKSMFHGIKIHCSHIICINCLSNYIFNQINNGITIIKCPSYKCKSLIDDCIIHILSDNITYKRYRQFLQNSFLETCKDWKFCPNPKCNSAIKSKRDIPILVCNCGIPLCTCCVNKFHWPLKCKENKQWVNKTKAKVKDSDIDPLLPDLPKFEGQKYTLLVQTKQCPKCKTPWEKNGGCNHIHCKKCKYHWCWVCLKEFNSWTHDDFYECKQGYITGTQKKRFEMEEPTQKYLQEYQNVVEQRKQIMMDHEEKIQGEMLRKSRTKKAIQHERASIFLAEKYLKKPKRLNGLLKNIIIATEKNNEKISKKLDIKFIEELIGRMIETHLLLSRGYKYISYHLLNENSTICNILKSLEHVAFKLDNMFQQPKVYLPWTQCRWKWYDLAFYIDFFTQEIIKHCTPNKKKKDANIYVDSKPKKQNPFMKVSNIQYE